MARNGISYSDVKHAIDEMQSEGLNPTIAGLRERLGTGSFTTISEHLKHWRSERQKQPMVAGGSPAPENLNSMVQAVWQQAREDATKELESYKQEIQKTLGAAEEEKQQALEHAVATEARNKWLEEKNEKLLEEIRELEKQNGILATEIEYLNEKNQELNAQLEHSKSELSLLQKHTEDLKEKHSSELNRNKETYLQERQKLQSDLQATLRLFEGQIDEERKRSEASEQHWIKQIDALRQQLKDKDVRQDKLEKKISEQNTQNKEQSNAITTTLGDILAKLEIGINSNRENENTLKALMLSTKEIQMSNHEELRPLRQDTLASFEDQKTTLSKLGDQTKKLTDTILRHSKKD